MKLESGQTILFTGDSITDCGRARPVGEGIGLGDGYVSLTDSALAAWAPERKITVLNTGVGGNTVVNVAERWEGDVLGLSPDWLSVMIGINDAWQQLSGTARGVSVERYEDTYRTILQHPPLGLEGLVLMTPYVIEPDRSDPTREMMDQYGEVVRRLAGEFGAVFVDVQEAFDDYLVHRAATTLAADRIHPNQTGHMIIARAFLLALEVVPAE